MTTIEKVKAKILDLAIRGKLVPQDPNDEPAAELLKRIRAEKEKLVKAKKIKKEKNPSEIVIGSDGRPYEKFADGKTVCIEDEIPFDLPPGWTWARIGELCLDFKYGTAEKSQKTGLVPVLRMGNIQNGEISYEELVYTSNQDDIVQYALIDGDLLFNRTNSNEKVGKVAIFRGKKPCIYAGYLVRFRPISCNSEYINFVMNTRYQWLFCQSVKSDAVNQSNISASKFMRFIVPLPPLAEQKRIVVKIEELFAEVDKIATAKDGIARTVERINKKVLDLAIRGQLVPQDPNDEPAEELLKRIAEARQKVTAGRSRTTAKGESVIFRSADRSAYETRNGKTVCIDDEIPFDISDSWAWARLGSISDYGKCVSIDTHILPSDTWSLDLEEIEKGTGRLIERKTVGEKVSTSAKHVFKKGMVLYSKLRTYLNKVLIADVDGVCTSEIIPITLEGDILPEYLRHVLMSSYFLAYTASKDYGVKMPRVGTEDARKALIPIPPLAEQKRIVAKIEEIRTRVELIART